MDIIWRSALGGVFIAVVLYLSRRMGPMMAGLFIFFPFISLPAYYFIACDQGMDKVRQTLVGSIISIPVWLAFAVTLYICSLRFKIIPSMVLSLVAWLVTAAIVLMMRRVA